MKIIGVELRVSNWSSQYGEDRIEAQMFACDILIPTSPTNYGGEREPEAEITIHATHGDRTMRIPLGYNPPEPGPLSKLNGHHVVR